MSGPLPPHLRPGGMEQVWESLAKLEAVRREARVQSALLGLGATKIGLDLSKPDSLLDTAATVAEAEDASITASESAVEIAHSRRRYLEAGVPAEQLDLAVLQAWAKEHWQINSDPHLSLLLHWLRSPWDDNQDLAVTIVQMIGRITQGKDAAS